GPAGARRCSRAAPVRSTTASAAAASRTSPPLGPRVELLHDHEFDAAVLGAADEVAVVGDGAVGAEALGGQALGIDVAVVDEPAAHGGGALARQLEPFERRRLAVHVALDAQLQDLGVQVEDARDDAEQLGRALVDDAAVALEEHRLEDDDAIADERGERRRLIGAAVVVDTVPRLGIERALVEAIDVAVAVGVEVGAALVLARAGLVGAAIVGVGDAVAVLIGRRAAAEL